MLPFVRTIMLMITLGALLVGGGSALVAHEVRRPGDARDSHVYVVEVEAGATVAEVAATLDRDGLIAHPHLFCWIAQAHQVKVLAPGTYRLRKTMTMRDMVTYMQADPPDAASTTIQHPGETP